MFSKDEAGPGHSIRLRLFAADLEASLSAVVGRHYGTGLLGDVCLYFGFSAAQRELG